VAVGAVRMAEVIVALALCCIALCAASLVVLAFRWFRGWALPFRREVLAEQREAARRQETTRREFEREWRRWGR